MAKGNAGVFNDCNLAQRAGLFINDVRPGNTQRLAQVFVGGRLYFQPRIGRQHSREQSQADKHPHQPSLLHPQFDDRDRGGQQGECRKQD